MELKEKLSYGGMRALLFSVCFAGFVQLAEAQMTPPGQERQKRLIERMQLGNALDRDSVTIMDTIVVYDPDTYSETFTVMQTTLSLRSYCREELGINDPDILLGGQVIEIDNPVTYEKMQIRYDPRAGKIDTIK